MADMKSGLADDSEDLSKVMVMNLNKTVTKETLEQFLVEKCSQVNLTSADFKEIKVMENTKGGKNNYAFVTLTTTSATDHMIAALYSIADEDRKLEDNTIQVKRAVPKKMMNLEQEKNWGAVTKKLFLANLPKTASKSKNMEDLETIIGGAIGPDCPLGKVGEYQVVMVKADGAETEQCRGIAFVKLDSRDGVSDADKEKDKLPEHLADKLAIQFGNPFNVGGRSVDLKKNSEEGDANRGSFRGRGRGGMPRGAGARGMRGGMRGAMRGGMGGGYGAGAYGQAAYAADPYAAAYADPYAAAAYGGYGQMAGGYGYGQAGYGY